jgi:hypothetical protein
MRTYFAVLLFFHGAVHLLGLLGSLEPVGPSLGERTLWLMASVLLMLAGVLYVSAPRHWWLPAVPGVLLSQGLVFSAWAGARFGTLLNLVVLVPLLLALADLRPSSLRSAYLREVRARRVDGPARFHAATDAGNDAGNDAVTYDDLRDLPPQVRTYLVRVGVVGKPRVRSFRARFRASMRTAPDARWMPAVVEQHGFFEPLARLFFMKAHRGPVPFDVFHRYRGGSATMEARAAGLLEVLDVGGPELFRSETVTVLNDMFVLAPAALLDQDIEWAVLDGQRVRAIWENAGQRVTAVVHFDEQGDLVGFHSDDRYQSDGRSHRLVRWSTPLGGYRDFGGVRLAAEGEARWSEPTGEWAYGRFLLEEIEYGVGGRSGRRRGPGVAWRCAPGTALQSAWGALQIGVQLLLGPVLHRWRTRWGASPAELARRLPGDELVEAPDWWYDHAITIEAPRAVVWRWLVQLGQGRGGFYSYQGLENLVGCGIENVEEIRPELQTLEPGDTVRMHASGFGPPVTVLEPERALVLGGPPDRDGSQATWAFHLLDGPHGSTRLLERGQGKAGRGLLAKLGYGPWLMDPVGFVMSRKMLATLKRLAEREYAIQLVGASGDGSDPTRATATPT